MKDNFSIRSDNYARYRPTYPPAVFDYLTTLLPDRQNAWDCGTGNGQVAFELAKTFDTVFATDISAAQLAQAARADNIIYSVQPAEKTNFTDGQFDLVTVAQAIHWFDFDRFYAEVKRTAKKGALLCVIGYGKLKITDPIDSRIDNFYDNVVGPYWDKERKYLDENYETIPFPFNEIKAPAFENKLEWTLEHLVGYLNTWSAVKHFRTQNGYNPVESLQQEIAPYWGSTPTRAVHFPLLLRIGQIA